MVEMKKLFVIFPLLFVGCDSLDSVPTCEPDVIYPCYYGPTHIEGASYCNEDASGYTKCEYPDSGLDE